MDVYQNIWSSCDKVQLDRHGRLVSDAAVQHGLFQHEDDKLLKAHVREVNSLLNNNKTRDRGLRLLADLVPQCTQQVLSAQCERWFRFCCDAVTGVQRGRRVEQACQLVSALLRDLPSLPELQRCVTSKASAAIVLELAAIDPQKNPSALECVYEYVRAAPGPCLQHKTVLEERMLNHLDYPVTPASLGGGVVRLAGKVFAALPLPGVGGGNVAQSRADARGRQLTLLLALAHSLMDTLLDGVLEKESYPHSRDHSSLKLRPVEDVTSDPMTTRLVSIARLSNTLTFVAEMVTDAANAAITITPDHLLSVVFRLLQMESGVLARYKSQEHKLVAFFLPSLHNQALLLLRDIINSLGDAVDSYHNILGDLLVFVLRSYKSSGAKEKVERPVWCSGGLETRVLTYGVLAELLKASRGRHSPPSGLVAMVVQDAGPQEHRVKLQEKGLASLSLHKAAGKKKGYTVTSQASSGGSSGPLPRPGRFSRLARVSLVVAEMLFTHSSHSMTFEDHQRLQSGVLTIAEGVVGASHPPEIYRDARVRIQLFHTLAALSAAPHPRCPPPYTLLTHLLHSGSMDSDTQVASACQMALCAVSLVVANPKVELASQAFRQHQHDSGGINGDTQDEGKDAEVDMIIEQLQEEEEEEEEKEEEEEVTEEPTVSNKEMQEDSADEEEEEEEDDDDDEVQEEEKANVWGNSDSKESDDDEAEDLGEEVADIEKEIKDSEEEEKEEEEEVEDGNAKGGNRGKKGKGKTSSRKKEPVEDSDEKEEEREGDEEEDEDEDEETEKVKIGGKKGGERKTERSDSGKGKQSQEAQTKASKKRTKNRKRMKNKQKVTEEEMEEANSSSAVKRNGSKSDQPAKRVKPSGDQEISRESKELTVDEMLKDFVG